MKRSNTVICALLVSVLSAPVLAAPSSWSSNKEDQRELKQVENKIEARQYQAAIDDLKGMLASDPANADVYNLLGYSHRKMKRYELAESYYDQALHLDPKHKGAMEYLGELYVETGRMEEAEAMLARLDKACLFTCEEYKQLKTYIEQKEQGLASHTSW